MSENVPFLVPKLNEQQKTWLAIGIVLLVISASIFVYFFYFAPQTVVVQQTKLNIRATHYYGPEGESLPDTLSIPVTVLDSDYQVLISAVLDKDNSFATSADITSPGGWVLVRGHIDDWYLIVDGAEKVIYNNKVYYNITLSETKTDVMLQFAPVATVSGVTVVNGSVNVNSSYAYVLFNMTALSMLQDVNFTFTLSTEEAKINHAYYKLADGALVELNITNDSTEYWLTELFTLDNHDDGTAVITIMIDLYAPVSTTISVSGTYVNEDNDETSLLSVDVYVV